jgi:hypothetical protein
MSDIERELYRVHRETQNKYVYFLLAAVGAALGFALAQTKDQSLGFSHIILFIALLSWGLSFYFGCKQLQKIMGAMYENMELLEVNKGEHPLVGNNPNAIAHMRKFIKNRLEKASEEASLYGNKQFEYFIVGSFIYILWHVFEMLIKNQPFYSWIKLSLNYLYRLIT